jgi:hypothetical protein
MFQRQRVLLLPNSSFWELSEIRKLVVDRGTPLILESSEPVRLQYMPTVLSVKLASRNLSHLESFTVRG